MSESMSGKRIWAARTARRFPVILQMVARGELHLTGIVTLARHLTEDNHRALLGRARHKSSREIDLLVAEVAPQPDAPPRIRALPNLSGSAVRPQRSPTSGRTSGGPERTAGRCSRAASSAPGPAIEYTPSAPEQTAGNRSPAASNARRPHKQVVPLAPRRYKIEITVDQQTHDNLRMLEDLLSHELRAADPAVIVSRAIDLLLADTLKKKAALTDKARPRDRSTARPAARRTRAIPAALRREVWQRDGGRCAFFDEGGRRCRATRHMEYHHDTPYGKGGQHNASNIALRCRAHNQYEADLDFGRKFMDCKRRGNAPHSAWNVRSSSGGPLHAERRHGIDGPPG